MLLYLGCLYEGKVSSADDDPRTAEFARFSKGGVILQT